MPAVQRGEDKKLSGGGWAYRYRDASGKLKVLVVVMRGESEPH